MAFIIDGKALQEKILGELKKSLEEIKDYGTPCLRVILIGNNPSSVIYVRNKTKVAKELGIDAETIHLPEDVKREEVLELLQSLNKDPKVSGILVQLPLPSHLDPDEVTLNIDPAKDVDGLHPWNMGLLFQGKPQILPCTPFGIMRMIKEVNYEIKGKRAVVIGRSNIVGKPVAQLLLMEDATVTICHSKTKDLPEITKTADILVVAIGKPEFVRGDMVKEGAFVIDVGINRINGKIKGDVAFDEVKEVASYITPVPGGVGPMTIAMLMYNVVQTFKFKEGIA